MRPAIFSKISSILIVLFLIGFSSQKLFAEEHSSADTQKTTDQESHESEFNAGEFVIHHVSDAFEWHILTYKGKHISIPLPIILHSKNSGWHFFMSSAFHHSPTGVHENFRIAHEGENAGKIEELDAQGQVVDLPIDLSITKAVAGIFFSMIVILWLFLSVAKSAKRSAGQAPKGVQNLVEPIILFIRDEVAKPAIGNKYEKFMPFLLTVFFFILINNVMGLIPIFPFGANVTGNIAVTMVLALFTFGITTINGNKHYWKEIYNPDVPWWLKYPLPLMPIVELTGVFTKPFVLMVRLFANMMAGHMIVTVFVSLIFIFTSLKGPVIGASVSPLSVAFSAFILLLDVLVSFIQAYVFTLLSALYFGMATSEHH